MKLNRRKFLIGSAAFLTCSLAISTTALAGKRMVFGGGPAGGTFQIVANSIQTYDPVKESKDYTVKAQSSAGSVENLRKVDSGKMQFGVVYSGHVYLGREGRLKNDTNKYENVLAVSYLYGAPAQLVAKKGSGIKSTKDLVGKKVGVGNAGSGAFANCELFFTHMGVWDKIERNAMGYNDAAAAFGNNQLDAFWLFTAFPSGAVIMAAQTNDIELVDLGQDALDSGFYEKYPYFSKLKVPAGTYKGVDEDVPVIPGLGALGRQRGRPGGRGLRPALQDLHRRGSQVHGQPEEDLQGDERRDRHQRRRHPDASGRREVLEGKRPALIPWASRPTLTQGRGERRGTIQAVPRTRRRKAPAGRMV